MNKIEQLEKEIANGYRNLSTQQMSDYIELVFRAIGPNLTEQIHSKARSIYYRYEVLEPCRNEDDEYLNEKSELFLNHWNSSNDSVSIATDMTNIKSAQHLTAVMKIVLSVLKAHLLVEKALEIKRKKETT